MNSLEVQEEARSPQPRGLNLLVDADDTLWSNAIYFAAARDSFEELMRTRGVDVRTSAATLSEVEAVHLARRWYGSRRLIASMHTAAAKMMPGIDPVTRAEITTIGETLLSHEIRFHACVLPTLASLRRRHRLVLMTMGEEAEQSSKIARSGIRSYFTHIEIVADKDDDAYAALLAKLELDRTKTWMIGNSGKKDIEPANRTGLKTAWIPAAPHDLDDRHQPSCRPDLRLQSFAELKCHF